MPADTDPASAARRVALTTRNHEIGRGGPAFTHADLVALLPFLDAVAAGPDADRLERYSRTIAHETGYGDADIERMGWENWEGAARAAIALADAEVAAKREAGWRAYEEALDAYRDTALECGQGLLINTDGDMAAHRAALDAAVRALAGLETTEAPTAGAGRLRVAAT